MSRPHQPSTDHVSKLFAGSRLTLARHLAGLRKSELADRIGKTPTAIGAYESERKRPSSATVAQLCMALGVEPAFFLPSSVTASTAQALVANYRSLRSTSQLARDQATAYGAIVHEIVSVFERRVEMPAIDVPAYPVDISEDPGLQDSIRSAVDLLRLTWDIDTTPINHVLRLAENHGVVCVFSPFQVASVDAYSFQTRLRPVIIMNPLKGDYYRQRFDLAHEVGHLVMHGDAEPGNHAVELQAHRFAAELLMPHDIIKDQLPRRLLWPKLLALKEYWGVSLQALLYRARELGIYSDTTYRNAMKRISKEGWRRQEPGAHPNIEEPSLLPKALQLLEDAGVPAARLAAEARVPMNLFDIATARNLESVSRAIPVTGRADESPGTRPVSVL
jgi:Zn-dependent peptidase ImmA (M78 family)/transcriptional regulator with XRE-family HTH domain